MSRSPIRHVATHAVALLALAACGGSARQGAGDAMAPVPMPAADATTAPVTASRAAIEKARADSARLPWTAADAQFMAMMIGHHAQAVTMARLVPTREASPAVQRLAERIISAQQDEIRTMQQWLADREQPVPRPDAADPHAAHGSPPAPAATSAHGSHGTMGAMPGMLTDDQLRQLAATRGPEFDRLFLTFMIQHHRGAVAMVDRLFGTYGAGQDEAVFKFASDVQVDQRTEVARMQRMLLASEVLAPSR